MHYKISSYPRIMEEEIFDLRVLSAKLTKDLEEMTRSRTPRLLKLTYHK